MRPIAIQAVGTVPDRANVTSALARNLPEFSPGVVAHDGTMVCVASGPSMPQYVEAIRYERKLGRPIFAVKGAHDFLCEQDIIPDLYICVDPTPATHPAHKLERVNDQTLYVLASRCHPSMFDLVDGRSVMVFHSWSPHENYEEFKGKVLVGGGSTSGLRAIMLSYLWGFRNIKLYGFDSCLAADRTTKRFTGENTGESPVYPVFVDGKRFWCNAAMHAQAYEIQHYYKWCPGLHLDAVGDGLIPAILEARRKREFPA